MDQDLSLVQYLIEIPQEVECHCDPQLIHRLTADMHAQGPSTLYLDLVLLETDIAKTGSATQQLRVDPNDSVDPESVLTLADQLPIKRGNHLTLLGHNSPDPLKDSSFSNTQRTKRQDSIFSATFSNLPSATIPFLLSATLPRSSCASSDQMVPQRDSETFRRSPGTLGYSTTPMRPSATVKRESTTTHYGISTPPLLLKGPNKLFVHIDPKDALLAVNKYSPCQSDEIRVAINDKMRLVHLFRDGWVLAHNITSGNTGVVPSECLPAFAVDHSKTPASFGSNGSVISTPGGMINSSLNDQGGKSTIPELEQHQMVDHGSRRKMIVVMLCLLVLIVIFIFGLLYGKIVQL